LFLFSGFSAGALTALNYARRMSAMPAELLASQISSVTAIKFNEQAARHDLGGMGLSFDRIQRLLILTLTPLAFMLALTGRPLIQILFGRGEFGAEAVTETAWLFSVLILALPLEALNSVVARMNIARQEVAFGTWWQIFGNALNALLVYVFVRRMGTIGFPVATCVFMLLYLAALTRPFSIRMAPASLWPTMKSLAWTTGACTAAAAVAWGGRAWLLPVGTGPWLEGLALAGAFAVVYAGILRYFPPDREGRNEGLALVRAAIHPSASKPKAPTS
jgi:putative peptidoglycan lipid II flippase